MGQRWMEAAAIMPATAIDPGSTSYSVSLGSLNLVGTYAGLYILTSATGTMTITQQVSIDGATWIDPTNSTLTAVGAVYNALSLLTTRYIQFTPILAPYVRMKVVPTEANTVTLKLVTQGERM